MCIDDGCYKLNYYDATDDVDDNDDEDRECIGDVHSIGSMWLHSSVPSSEYM